MIISGLEANNMNFKILCQTGLFYYIVLHCIVFYDVNITISPLDRPITTEFTKEVS